MPKVIEVADNPESDVPDYVRQLELVGRMTELNSRHLKSEGRRGGLEVEIVRCEEAIARGDRSEDFQAALDLLLQDLAAVERTRTEIDQERARLDLALNVLGARSRNGT